jgi:hypothetical protein
MTNDIFDFGFTAVDEADMGSFQNLEETKTKLEHAHSKLDSLYHSILPLLNNLKKNPDKDYIFWPKRNGKILEFEKKIEAIYKS